MQYVQPAGQPRLVSMNVKGPLIYGMRYFCKGSNSCMGIGMSSRSATNGRGKFKMIWPSLRQAMPLMPCIFSEPSSLKDGLYIGSCLSKIFLISGERSSILPRDDPTDRGL